MGDLMRPDATTRLAATPRRLRFGAASWQGRSAASSRLRFGAEPRRGH
ncbi:hypothetical protein [Actinocatenispora comari]|nr:hypothetical protein [Actinocatenispora comari]